MRSSRLLRALTSASDYTFLVNMCAAISHMTSLKVRRQPGYAALWPPSISGAKGLDMPLSQFAQLITGWSSLIALAGQDKTNAGIITQSSILKQVKLTPVA